MWEIAEAMISWDLCNKCWCALECESHWFPINCMSCHNKHAMMPEDWIYSEAFFQKMQKNQDLSMYWKALVVYHAEVEWIKKFTEPQLTFISRLLAEMMTEDDTDEPNIS